MSKYPSLAMFAVQAGLWFGAVSLGVFGTVAYAEGWMYANLTPGGAYAAWTLLFIGLGGLVLRDLAPPAKRRAFPLIFGAAFLAYAFAWIACYFLLRGGPVGEWLGSAAGSLLMALVFVIAFKATWAIGAQFFLALFVANSLGYFLGSAVNDALGGPLGMLLWGALYGVFLGAGLGMVLHWAPRPANAARA